MLALFRTVISSNLAQTTLRNGPSVLAPQSCLLAPQTCLLVPQNGYKVKGRVKPRCADCLLVRRGQRWFVECKTHPRHKQMSMIQDPQHTWFLSHATQGKTRPW